MNRGLNSSANSIGSCQPLQSAQSRTFWLLVDFLQGKGPFYLQIQLDFIQNRFYRSRVMWCLSRYNTRGECIIPLPHWNAESHGSVSSVADFRTRGRWFDPRLGQYSFRGLMIVIATGFIPLSPLSFGSKMVKWKSRQWLGKNSVWSTG